MHQTGFQRITDARPLCFTIVRDIHCHSQIRCGIHINMAIAGSRLDHRKRCIFYNSLNQARTTSWDQHIDQTVCLHHLGGHLSGSILDQLHDILRKTTLGNCLPHSIHQYLIGTDCLLASPQDCCISAFDTKRSRIHCNIGT